MVEIRCTQPIWHRLRDILQERRDVETAVFILCKPVQSGALTALLTRELVPIPQEAYEVRDAAIVRIQREFVHSILQRCAEEKLSLVEAHIHPFSDNVMFSALDMHSDLAKFRATECMCPPFIHATLVFGRNMSFQGHLWDYRNQRMVQVERLKVLTPTSLQIRFATDATSKPLAEAQREVFDRQIRALGEAGQRILSDLTVALVGAGGLGSIIAYELALLGVGRLILVDPDRLETTNANRIFGVTRKQIEAGMPKVVALAQNLPRIGWGCTRIIPLARSVLDRAVWRRLAWADVMIGATDSATARHFLNLFSVACLISFIDGGVGIVTEQGQIRNAGGQVRTVVPGSGFCLDCLGADMQALVEENLTDEERETRRQAGYIVGENVPNPQVAFLNGVVANLLLWEFVKLATGAGETTEYVYYDACRQQVFSVAANRRANCFTCSPSGVLAGGLEAVRLFCPARTKRPTSIPPSPTAVEQEPLPPPPPEEEPVHVVEAEREIDETVRRPAQEQRSRRAEPKRKPHLPVGIDFEFSVRLRFGLQPRAHGQETGVSSADQR